MNLKKLFDMQRELDERIVRGKGLEGKDLLPMRILALQVELGELANEWRGFKFWSDDREPRTIAERGACKHCAGTGSIIPGAEGVPECWACGGAGEEIYNPLLEEYVDCLHFILSIGLELEITDIQMKVNKTNDITRTFIDLILGAGTLAYPESVKTQNYIKIFNQFIRLGELLGFTWDEIEQAYIEKNKVNHNRQASGY